MMFALSAPIDAKFLKVIQKYAFVKLDEMRRIKKYKAHDGSLELEGDHSLFAKANASSGSTGEKYSQFSRMSHNLTAIQKVRKRVRQISEGDYGEKSLKVEGDLAMDFDANHVIHGRYDYCDYDPPSYKEEMDPMQEEKKPEYLIEVKTEVQEMSSANIGGPHRIFDYNPPSYEEDLGNIPTEKKPVSLIEVKTEIPQGPSTSNFEYHYEENLDHILIEPKSDIFC